MRRRILEPPPGGQPRANGEEAEHESDRKLDVRAEPERIVVDVERIEACADRLHLRVGEQALAQIRGQRFETSLDRRLCGAALFRHEQSIPDHEHVIAGGHFAAGFHAGPPANGDLLNAGVDGLGARHTNVISRRLGQLANLRELVRTKIEWSFEAVGQIAPFGGNADGHRAEDDEPGDDAPPGRARGHRVDPRLHRYTTSGFAATCGEA